MRSPVDYVESMRWQSNNGQTASVYGSVPYHSEEQKIKEGWKVVKTGWIPMWKDGTVGGGRPPHATLEEAQAFYGQ
jgi:hypothetical protein